MSVLAIDLGGSHVTSAVVADGQILASSSMRTNAGSLKQLMPEIERNLVDLCEHANVPIAQCSGIGMGFPAIVDAGSGEILSRFTKYADGVSGTELRDWADRKFGLPIAIENDAKLALLGEHAYGAAKGFADVVMITLGTGIGAAAMLGNQLLKSRMGHAGQLGGHLTVNLAGRLCACGAVGCAEAEASTSTLPLLCREHPAFASSALAQESSLDFEAVFRCKDAGDWVATEIFNRCIHVWSVLTVTLIHAYGPEILLFGGGVLRRKAEILPPIRKYVDTHSWKTASGDVRIQAAELGETAALIGAEALFTRRA